MAFKGRGTPETDFLDLLTTLTGSNIQTTNYQLYQTIKQLIEKSQQSKNQINQILQTFIGDIQITDDIDLSAILTLLANLATLLDTGTFLTSTNQAALFPASRELIAGSGIVFDDTVANERTISTSGTPTDGYWSLLTDGDEDETDFIFADGDPIALFIPVP